MKTPDKGAGQDGASQLIYGVEEVYCMPDKANGVMAVMAKGWTSTSGWTQPQLVQTTSVSSGVYVFRFVATPPPPPSLQVLTPLFGFLVLELTEPCKEVVVESGSGHAIWPSVQTRG